MIKKTILVISIALLFALAGYGAYTWFRWEKLPLDELAPHAETERYTALFERLEAHAGDDENFSFVVLGDTRSNYGMALRVLEAAAAESPRFILSNGDLVRRGRVEEYLSHHLRLVESVAPIPFIPVPGNHEEGPNRDFSAFKKLYGDEQFSFDYGGCRFVGINNSRRWGLTRAHLRYLETELSKPGARHKFVLFHVPPRDLDIYVDTEEGRGFRKNSAALKSLLQQMEVDHVFMGHIHGYATTMVDGVRYTISGGGGASLTDRLGQEGNVHNYLVIHVSADGLETEVVRMMEDAWTRSKI